MFIGHFGVALAAKKAAPKVSLGWLVAAAIFLDLAWPPLLLLGVEHGRIVPGFTAAVPMDLYDYPWSHSLLMSAVYGALLGGVYYARKKDQGDRGAALIIAAVAVSHWVLDFISHAPDMPLAPGLDAKFGLGLWNSIPATMAVEIPLFLAGLYLYLSTPRPRTRGGKYGMPLFAAFLMVAYFGNLFGPPPPSMEAIGYVGMLMVLFVPLCAWLDAESSSA